jgi:hypothetical protein
MEGLRFESDVQRFVDVRRRLDLVDVEVEVVATGRVIDGE